MTRTTIKLAIFTIFTAAVTVLLATVIGNISLFASRYVLEVEFDDATGLLRNDLVTLGGVDVGKVKGASVERGVAIVELVIDQEVKLPKGSTEFNIRYRNLIGQRIVKIEPNSSGGGPFWQEGERVPKKFTDGPLDLDTVFNNLKPLVSDIEGADINTLSKATVESFGAHKDDLDKILANTATLAGDLASKKDNLSSLLVNIDQTATSLASEKDQLLRLLSNLSNVTGRLAADGGQLDRTLINLDKSLGDFADLFEGNRPALDRDLESLASILRVVATNQSDLDQITKQLHNVLRSTARATTFGEYANLYVFSLCEVADPGCPAASASTAAAFGSPRDTTVRDFLYRSLGVSS